MEYYLGTNEELSKELVELRKRNRELEFMLDTFFNSSPLGLCVLDQKLRYVRINERLAEINGMSVAGHLGRTLGDVLPKLSEQAEQPLRNVLATGEAMINIQLINETPAHPGLQRFCEEKWVPIKDDLGQVIGISVIVEDVTARKQAEQKLRASEEKLRSILENSADAISMLDLATGKYIFMSPAQVELTGFTAEEINNISAEEAYDRVHPDERKEAEEALKRSEAKYRTLFNSMDEGHCAIDVIFDNHGKPVDWRYIEVNPAFEKQGGYPNVVGKLVSDVAPETEEHWFELYGKVAETGIPVRSINEFKASNSWFEINAYKIGGEESKKVGVTFYDITERKQREDKIAFQAELLANVHDAVVVCDENEKLTYVNKSFERMFGWTAQEVLGRSFKDFESNYLSVESRDKLVNRQNMATAAFARALEQGGQIDLQFRLRLLDGSLRWIETRGYTEQDEKGNPVHSYGVTLDITRQKMAEQKMRMNEERLKALNEQLRQRDGNKSHFLSVLSHELRNPLASIMMGIELLKGTKQEAYKKNRLERSWSVKGGI